MNTKSSGKSWGSEEHNRLLVSIKECNTLSELADMHNGYGYKRTNSAISSHIDQSRHEEIICVMYNKRRDFKPFESAALRSYVKDTIGERTIEEFIKSKSEITDIMKMFCRSSTNIIKHIKTLNLQTEDVPIDVVQTENVQTENVPIEDECSENPFSCNEATKPKEEEVPMDTQIDDAVELVRIETLMANIMLANPKVTYGDAKSAAMRIVRGGIASTNDMVSNLYNIMSDDVKLTINKLSTAVEINANHIDNKNMTIVVIYS